MMCDVNQPSTTGLDMLSHLRFSGNSGVIAGCGEESTCFPHLSPQGEMSFRENYASVVTAPETAKRPVVLAHWAASDPLAHGKYGGTLMESSNALERAAITHLRLLREDHDRLDSMDRYYVHLGFSYGLSVAEIALTSGLGVEYVRHLLGGDA